MQNYHIFLFILFLTNTLSAQSNRFDFDNWPTGSTDVTNRVGTCTMRTQVSGSDYQNSAPRYDDAGVSYSPTNGEGLALDHNWANTTTTTTVTLTFSPAIVNPTFSIFDINRNNPCAAFCSSAWIDRVQVSTNSGTVTATAVAPTEQTITNSGTSTVTVVGNMVCGGVNGAVNFAVSGTPTVITITYSSGPTVDRTSAASPNTCGASGGETNCRNNRSACVDPGRQFITIGSISGSTCCLSTPIGQRDAPTGAQCSGTQLNFSSNPGGNNGVLSYQWDTNNPVSSGTSSTFSITPVNNSTTDITVPVSLQVTSNVSTGANRGQTICPASFSPTIRPIPTVNDPADQNLCNGLQTAPVNFSGNGVPATVFNWSNNNTAIGLPASGSGNIAAFTAQTGIASVTVTPVANGCTGTPQVFNFDIEGCNLPVEFLYFNGHAEKEGFHYLYWATATESNCAFYEIEYSLNAIEYQSIGKVNSLTANGNSSHNLFYDFTFRPGAAAIHYYRLKQFDLDGTYEYSNVIAIVGKNELSEITLYPNPAENNINLFVPVSLLGQSYDIFSISGQYIKSGNIIEQYNTIAVNDLAGGMYIIRFKNGTYQKMFSVKN
jgi:hypothetical protein